MLNIVLPSVFRNRRHLLSGCEISSLSTKRGRSSWGISNSPLLHPKGCLSFHVPCLAARLVQAMKLAVILSVYRFIRSIVSIKSSVLLPMTISECMHRWMGGQKHTDFMRILNLTACQNSGRSHGHMCS